MMTSNRAFLKARLFFFVLVPGEGQDCPVCPADVQYSLILDFSIGLFETFVQGCSISSCRGNEKALRSATLFILLVFDG